MSRSGLADVVKRRTLLVVALLTVIAVAYVLAFATLKSNGVFEAQTFAAATAGGEPLDAFLEVTAVDAVRQSMELRFDVATGAGSHGKRYFGRLDRDVDLRVSDGEAEQDFRLRRGEPLSSSVFFAGLHGSVSRYPFDGYSASIFISATALPAVSAGKAIPVSVAVWEGLPDWLLSVKQAPSSGLARELRLTFDMHRPAALVTFSCVIYGLMVFIAVCAITIGALTFIGVRRIEVTFVGALTGMVFALPILRNALPGEPPLGVRADIFVLLWTQIATIVGLSLCVGAWVQRGSKP